MRKLIPFAIVIILILLALTISTIGLQYMWSDEVYSFYAAKMIIEKGSPLFDSGLFYGRAQIYHYLLALSMKVFGINEFGSRIINVAFIIGASILLGLIIYELLRNARIERSKQLILSFTTPVLYFVSNFATAMMRETRMYSMSTFFFVFSVFLLYKAFINPQKKGLIHIQLLDLKVNLYYAIAFLPVFYIAYDTQPISILLGLGLIIFFISSALLKKRYRQILIAMGIFISGLILTYLKFDTLNMLIVFKELSPEWATGITPLFYSILTVRNLPFVLLTAPLALYYIIRKKDLFIAYVGSIIVAFWIFLSLQEAQHERYWQMVVPLIILLSVYVIVLFINQVVNKKVKTGLVILVLLFSLFHLYLAGKEYMEISTYTPHSLSIYKKLQYNEVFKYLDENKKPEDIIIADFHSAYTLYYKGYKIDYLLLPDNNINWEWGKDDLYFDIPLLKYSDLQSVISNTDGYAIIRDPQNFNGIPAFEIKEFIRPQVYKF